MWVVLNGNLGIGFWEKIFGNFFNLKKETMSFNIQDVDGISNTSIGLELGDVDIPKVIYGRTLSGKAVNKVGLKNLFESLWQHKAGVKIEDYTDGIFILTAESEAIKNRILKGQPWHFAGSYLILVEVEAMTQVSVDLFMKIPFWIQTHGLPIGLLANPVGERLGNEIANSIGDFLEFDPNYRSKFMRFRVAVDSSKPLARGKFLKIDKLKEKIWISFRYERLSKFCYFCGHIDHIQKECAALIEEIESGSMPVLQYNDSIKTTSLAHAIAPEANRANRPGKKLMGQKDALETEILSNMFAKIPNTKRSKMGNNNEDGGEFASRKERKETEERDINTSANTSRNAQRGSKIVSPIQKTTNQGNNAQSTK